MVPSRPSRMMRSRADQMRRAPPLHPDLHDALSFRAAASIACPSTTSTLIGFWTQTSSPDFRTSIIGSACQ